MNTEFSQKNTDILRSFTFPDPLSHKGQNGKILLIGGSRLFHAASLWALTTASRIVDLVHYASVVENNQIVTDAKREFRNGIVISRRDIEEYIVEDDAILIGPGMNRATVEEIYPYKTRNNMKLSDIDETYPDGVQTYLYTNILLQSYPQKLWILDAGALQMVEPQHIPSRAILTPHAGEFSLLWYKVFGAPPPSGASSSLEQVKKLATELRCVVLAKGVVDIVVDARTEHIQETHISGGNAGMTKGGTGDVLAGLITALSVHRDPFEAAVLGSMINKAAGDELYKTVGPYYNASDLADQIPKTMYRIKGK